MKIKCSSGLFLSKSGFTLIELLVVVLIIGILAAVALPQYQIAVEKARATQMLPMMRHIYEALALYKLQHGSYMTENEERPTWDDLGIEPPAGFECDGMDCWQNLWTCFPNEEVTGFVYCTSEKYDYYLLMFQPDESAYPAFAGKRLCASETDFGKRVCKALGGTELDEEWGDRTAFEF